MCNQLGLTYQSALPLLAEPGLAGRKNAALPQFQQADRRDVPVAAVGPKHCSAPRHLHSGPIQSTVILTLRAGVSMDNVAEGSNPAPPSVIRASVADSRNVRSPIGVPDATCAAKLIALRRFIERNPEATVIQRATASEQVAAASSN